MNKHRRRLPQLARPSIGVDSSRVSSTIVNRMNQKVQGLPPAHGFSSVLVFFFLTVLGVGLQRLADRSWQNESLSRFFYCGMVGPRNSEARRGPICDEEKKLKMDPGFEPDVNRTRNLLIWSQTRYHCATDPVVKKQIICT